MPIAAGRAVAVVGLVGVLAAGAGVASATSHRPTSPAKAHITTVRFTGSPSKPTITLAGSGFGHKPKPNLSIAPYNAGAKYNSDCSKQRVAGNGNDGHDYNQHSLGVGWGTTAPSGFSAGVYVHGSYLDCIGLRIVKYRPGKVVLRMGCQYALYPPIKSGNKALISVNGVRTRVTVHFHH